MDYAIIRVGGKQYRVREGETLVVDRVRTDEGETFEPDVLLGDGGDCRPRRCVAHERGPKIRIGKYRGARATSATTASAPRPARIEISLGDNERAAAKKKPAEQPRGRRHGAEAPAEPAVERQPRPRRSPEPR